MSIDEAPTVETVEETLRREFEAWIIRRGHYTAEQVKKRTVNGGYYYIGLSTWWSTWQEMYACMAEVLKPKAIDVRSCAVTKI